MLTIPLSHELHVSTKPLPSFSLLELNNSKDYFLLGASSSTHSALCDISLYILERLKLSRTVNKKWLEFTAHLLHVHVVCVRSILKHCSLQQEGIKQWCLTCFVDRKQDLLYCVYYECDIDSNSRVGVLRRDVIIVPI